MDVCSSSPGGTDATAALVHEPAAEPRAAVRRSILKLRSAVTSSPATVVELHASAQPPISGLKRRRSVQFCEAVVSGTCEDEVRGAHVAEPIARALSFDHISAPSAPTGEMSHAASGPRGWHEEECAPSCVRHADRLLAVEHQHVDDAARYSARALAAVASAPSADGSALSAAHVPRRISSLTPEALRALVASSTKSEAASPRTILRRLSHLTNSITSACVPATSVLHAHALGSSINGSFGSSSSSSSSNNNNSSSSSSSTNTAAVSVAGALSPSGQQLRGSNRAMRLQAAAMAGSPNLALSPSPRHVSVRAVLASPPVPTAPPQSPQSRPHSRSLFANDSPPATASAIVTATPASLASVVAPTAGAGHLFTPFRTNMEMKTDADAPVAEKEARVSPLANALWMLASTALGDQSSVSTPPQQAQDARIEQSPAHGTTCSTPRGSPATKQPVPAEVAPRVASVTRTSPPAPSLLNGEDAAAVTVAASPKTSTPDAALQASMSTPRGGDMLVRDRLFSFALSPVLPPDLLVDPSMLSESTLPLDDDAYPLESEAETDGGPVWAVCDAAPHPVLRFDDSPVPPHAHASSNACIANVHQTASAASPAAAPPAARAAPRARRARRAAEQVDNAVRAQRPAKRAHREVDDLRGSWEFWRMEREEKAAKNAPLNDTALTASDEFLDSLLYGQSQASRRRPTRHASVRSR